MGRTGKVQPQICGVVLGENLVTGTASGQIYVWEDAHVAKVVPAHRSMISSMHQVNREKMVTGSRDATIKVWDRSLECIRTFDMKQLAFSCLNPQVRAVCFDSTLERIAVGTASSDMFEIGFLSGSCTKLIEGHFNGECHGLASHPQ